MTKADAEKTTGQAGAQKAPRPPYGKRILWTLFIIVMVVVVWMLFPPRWPKAETPPQMSSDLVRSCKVTRDKFDVPHVDAQSEEAAYACWGYLHATDRGWQMDYLRRTAYGRLAELYGKKYLRQDFQMRILNFKRVADRWVDRMNATQTPYWRLLRFYVWGVNRGFSSLKQSGKRPYQWRSMRYHPPAWRMKDTVMIALLQSFYQTRRTFTQDLYHQRLRLQLGSVRYQQLFKTMQGFRMFDVPIMKQGEHALGPLAKTGSTKQPKPAPQANRPAPSSRPASRPIERKSVPSVRPAAPRPAAVPTRKPPVRRTMLMRQRMRRMLAIRKMESRWDWLADQRGGSNNWVLGPKRTKHGHALLANDPHLLIRTPAFWYEIHVRGGAMDVLGVGVPGIPSLVSGNNQHVAFGLTNGFGNAADLVRIRPKRDGRFTLAGKTYRIRAYRPLVWYKKGSLHIPIFWKGFGMTKIGPILPIRADVGEVILLRWSAYHIKKPPLSSAHTMILAKNAKEFDKALQQWTLPNWNFVFADVQGNIGYRQVGLVPKRLTGKRGYLDGNDPQQQWRGFFQPSEMPHLFNPARGFVVTANNRAYPRTFRYFMGAPYVLGFRAGRIETLIKKQAKHTLSSMQSIQVDVRVPAADLLLPLMLKKIEQKGLSKMGKGALSVLAKWDRKAELEQVAPTIFRMWVRRFEAQLFSRDIVRPQQAHRGRRDIHKKPRRKYIFRPGIEAMLRALQGKIELSNQISVPAILQKTLRETIAKLSKDLGPAMNKWTWSKYHKVGFYHLFGRKSPWRPKAQGKDGDNDTVNPGPVRGDGPFTVKGTASYRLVAELKPGRIRSWGVLAGKQRDTKPTKLGEQQKMWLRNQYRPRPYYDDEIKKHKKSEMTIKF